MSVLYSSVVVLSKLARNNNNCDGTVISVKRFTHDTTSGDEDGRDWQYSRIRCRN